MATTAEVDAALALLRANRMKLAQAADNRARCVIDRDTAAATLQDATAQVVAARDAVTAAKTALQTLLQQPET